jgi:hypothetical protein
MSNSHTMVYTKSLVVDLKLHESIKQVIDYHSVHELYELSVHPSIYAVRGSADDLPSKGCTWHESRRLAPSV